MKDIVLAKIKNVDHMELLILLDLERFIFLTCRRMCSFCVMNMSMLLD